MSNAATTPDGLVIHDKPSGCTSHDLLGQIRGVAMTRRGGGTRPPARP
ncbi:tRNA pseudouridine(55) synthase TruB, partial [Streptomyces sp. NPDC059082]